MPAPTPASVATLVVRPFRILSDDAGDELFARGFHEDVVTELTRFRSLAVLADAETDAAVDYEVQGSIRRGGDLLRVNAQLLEVGSGRHLWADRFEAGSSDPFGVQDQIASSVAGTLATHIDGVRLEQARRTPTTSLAAYECWLRGREALERGTIEGDAEARSYFHRALELDPEYSRAYAGLSLAHYNDWSCQSWHLWGEGEARAYEYAEKAVALDDRDALVHVVLGRVHLHRREFDLARKHLERALALNPNDPDVLANVSIWMSYLGEPTDGLALAERAMQLNPRHGDWYWGAAALSLFGLKRYDRAAEYAARAHAAFIDLPALRAAAEATLGNAERSREALDEFLAHFRAKITFGREPDAGEPLGWLVQVNPFRRPEDVAHWIEALRRAGLEEPARHDVTATRPAELPAVVNTFRREGELWTASFEGAGAQLTEVKGFHDLARLLAQPERPLHCLELAGAPPGSGEARVLDAPAKKAIEERLHELGEELEEARANHDTGREERAAAEIEALTDELTRALGLGGRSRALGRAAERARTAVTWRVRSAIKKVAAAHPRLGRHLEHSIRTGAFCEYAPETPVAWEL